ncbi:hypothetical protein R69927_05773 [Paraburkholderia domus]|nr:hypothetical protein R69927_05773 [Paraburkholderia domus]
MTVRFMRHALPGMRGQSKAHTIATGCGTGNGQLAAYYAPARVHLTFIIVCR